MHAAFEPIRRVSRFKEQDNGFMRILLSLGILSSHHIQPTALLTLSFLAAAAEETRIISYQKVPYIRDWWPT
jgi:hypothetical protein